MEFEHKSDDNAMNLLFTSGSLPDIIFWGFSGYPGGAQKAIGDGIIYPLNDLIEENAPDLLRTLKSDPDYFKGCMTADGDYIGFPFIRGDAELLSSSGMIVRDDWCNELGIDIPKTADQFHEMLRLFKEKKVQKYRYQRTIFGYVKCLIPESLHLHSDYRRQRIIKRMVKSISATLSLNIKSVLLI